MPYLARLANKLFNTPLMVSQNKLNAIVYGLSHRFGFEKEQLPEGMLISAKHDKYEFFYKVYNKVAVLEINGVLCEKGGFNANSDFVIGYSRIAKTLKELVNDDSVKAIMLVINSPGGEVTGAFQLFDVIKEVNAVKPIYAAVNDLAASAAYLLASACTSISVTSTASVGSIGVITCHVDLSKALENQGTKITPIFAGSHKADGNYFTPLSEDVRKNIQKDIDVIYDEFVNCVASVRPICIVTGKHLS